MLNRRRRHQTPTFLEGTPGLYVKRESPPRMPSTAPIPTKTNVVAGCSSNYGNPSRSLSSSRSSLLQSATNGAVRKATTLMGACGASTPALVASALYGSTNSIATTIGCDGRLGVRASSTAPGFYGQQINNFSSMNFSRLQKHQQQIHNGLKHEVAGRRLSHTPLRPQRRAALRNELSSHSFNNPPSSSWATNFGNGFSAMALNTCKEGVNLAPIILQQNNLSTDSGEELNNADLVTSLSFKNAVESLNDDDFFHNATESTGDQNYAQRTNVMAPRSTLMPCYGIVRQKTSVSSGSGIMTSRTNGAGSSVSMQSLPGSSILQDSAATSSTGAPVLSGSVVSVGNALANLEADLPLPDNWEVEVTPDGIRYYVDHNHKRTHWIHPLAVENLSLGWIKIFDQTHGVVYYNEIEQRSQFEHPGLATPAAVQFNSNVQPQFVAQLHQDSQIVENCLFEQTTANFVEDFNIINDGDVPEWIRLYSEAPFESDHLLNWDLFDLTQLEEFDQMLMKLFKQDAINTVIKYERPRREINNELARRNVISS